VRMVTATNVSLLTVALYLLDLAIKVVALGLVPEGRRPSSASAWLLLILFLPVIGLVAFWLIGSPRGVQVRLMFDHIGTSRIPGYRNMIKNLKQTAIEWHPMLPVQPLKGKWRRPDLRNHRKIVIIDGRVAFVGSLNMIDASYHNRKHERAGRKWRELMMQVSGPVVFSLNIVLPPTGTSRPTRCFVRTCSRTRPRWSPARCCAKSCRADRAFRTRTT